MSRRVLALALLLTGCASTPTPAPAPAPTQAPFTVVTCNVRYGTANDGADAWPLRRELLASTLVAAWPDVLGVQEALLFQLDFLAAHFPRHRRLGQGRDGGAAGEHAALFVDERRFAILDHGDFWLSPTPDVVAAKGWDAALPRICTWARLRDRTDGGEIMVWNTHFDHRGATARLESARLIARRLATVPGPHVVLGDLNAGEASPPLLALREAGLRDSFRDCAPDAREVGTFHGFRGGHGGNKIDYILIGPGLVTVTAAIFDEPGPDGRWPSDHHFVSAALRRP